MKFGNLEIKLGMSEVVVGAVVLITFFLMWKTIPPSNVDFFGTCLTALISWGAGYATGRLISKGEKE